MVAHYHPRLRVRSRLRLYLLDIFFHISSPYDGAHYRYAPYLRDALLLRLLIPHGRSRPCRTLARPSFYTTPPPLATALRRQHYVRAALRACCFSPSQV